MMKPSPMHPSHNTEGTPLSAVAQSRQLSKVLSRLPALSAKNTH